MMKAKDFAGLRRGTKLLHRNGEVCTFEFFEAARGRSRAQICCANDADQKTESLWIGDASPSDFVCTLSNSEASFLKKISFKKLKLQLFCQTQVRI